MNADHILNLSLVHLLHTVFFILVSETLKYASLSDSSDYQTSSCDRSTTNPVHDEYGNNITENFNHSIYKIININFTGMQNENERWRHSLSNTVSLFSMSHESVVRSRFLLAGYALSQMSLAPFIIETVLDTVCLEN